MMCDMTALKKTKWPAGGEERVVQAYLLRGCPRRVQIRHSPAAAGAGKVRGNAQLAPGGGHVRGGGFRVLLLIFVYLPLALVLLPLSFILWVGAPSLSLVMA